MFPKAFIKHTHPGTSLWVYANERSYVPPFKLVDSGVIPASFRFDSVLPASFRFILSHSGPFRSIPVRSGLFRLVPVRSGSLRLVPDDSGSFWLVPVCSSSFQLVPVRSDSFYFVRIGSGWFWFVPARSGSFWPVSACSGAFRFVPVQFFFQTIRSVLVSGNALKGERKTSSSITREVIDHNFQGHKKRRLKAWPRIEHHKSEFTCSSWRA